MKFLTKKIKGTSLGDLSGIAILFVVVGVLLAMGSYILSEIGTQLPANTAAQLAVGNASKGINVFSSWLPILGVVIVAAIVIGILISSFMGRRKE